MIEVFISDASYCKTLRWEGDKATGHVVCAMDEWLADRSIEICRWPVDEPGPWVVRGQTYTANIRKGWTYGFNDSQRDIAMLFKLTWV